MKAISSIIPLILRHRTLYLIAATSLIISTLFVLLLPKKIGEFLEATASDPSAVSVGAMLQPGLEILFLGIAQAVLAGIYGYLVAIASEHTGNDLRSRFFSNLLARSYLRDTPQRSGEIASEFVSDLAVIQSGVGDTLIALLRHVLFVVGALIFMFAINTKMALVTLGGATIVAGLCLLMIRFVTGALLDAQAQRADVIGSLLEASNNRYVIEAFDRSQYFIGRFRAKLNNLFLLLRRHQRFLALINPVIFMVLAGATAAVLYTGVVEIKAGTIQSSDLIAFLAYILILVAALMNAGTSAGGLVQAGALFTKHQHMLCEPPTKFDAPSKAPSATEQPRPIGYRFHDVHFRYPSSDKDVLRGVSFTIPVGQTTALIGESGAGKSTLSSLMLGLIEPTSGRVEILGDSAEFTDAVAVVPQNPFLFTGSIMENIRFGREEIDDAAAYRAARQAHIASFIESLPNGFDHVLEENAGNLSRGQQQRIALARALAGNPGTLILDEATASLDPTSEKAIAAALRELDGKRTIIVIAHKGLLLESIDYCIKLHDGLIEYAREARMPALASG
ncbi:MAG: ABC transporter ATP-binding protein [Sandaracinobacter sp.]